MDTLIATAGVLERLGRVFQLALATWDKSNAQTQELRLVIVDAVALHGTAERALTKCRSDFATLSRAWMRDVAALVRAIKDQAEAFERCLAVQYDELEPPATSLDLIVPPPPPRPPGADAPHDPKAPAPTLGAFADIVPWEVRRSLEANVHRYPGSSIYAPSTDYYKRPSAFDAVWRGLFQGRRFVFLHGAAGVGKTMLLNRLLQLHLVGQPYDVRSGRDKTVDAALKAFVARYPDGAVLCSIGPGGDSAGDMHGDPYAPSTPSPTASPPKATPPPADPKNAPTTPTEAMSRTRSEFIVRKLVDLAAQLGFPPPVDSHPESVVAARVMLRRAAVASRHLLLVDDVGEADREVFDALCEAYDPDKGCGGGVVLVSRHQYGVGVEGVSAVELREEDYEDVDEAVFASYVYENSRHSELKPEHKEIGAPLLRLCARNPLTLKLAAEAARESEIRSSDAAVAWARVHTDVSAALQTTAADRRPFAAVAAAFKCVCGGAKSLLRVLQMFLPATRIPAAAVELVWSYFYEKGRGQMRVWETFSMCVRDLERYGLVEFHDRRYLEDVEFILYPAVVAAYMDERARTKAEPALPPLPVPSLPHPNPLRQILGHPLSAEQAARTPELRVLVALAFYGNPACRAAAEDSLNKIKLPATATERDWWRASRLQGCHPRSLFKSCIVPSGRYCEMEGPRFDEYDPPLPELDQAAVSSLLLSAVRGEVWPELEAHLPELLRRRTSLLAGVAFVVGTAMLDGMKGWSPAATAAVTACAERLQANEWSCTLLDKVRAPVAALGLHDCALKLNRRALAIREAMQGASPDAAKVHDQIACALRRLGRPQTALENAGRALAYRIAALGTRHPDVARSLDSVGVTLHAVGRFEDSLEHKLRSLELRASALGERHPETARSLDSVAQTLDRLGRHKEALESAQHALAIRLMAFGEWHIETARSLDSVGRLLGQLGRADESLQHREHALDIRRVVQGFFHLDTGKAAEGVAVSLRKMGRAADGIVHARDVLHARNLALGGFHQDTARAHDFLGSLLHEAGFYRQAFSEKQTALRIRVKVYGQDGLEVAHSLRSIGETLVKLDRVAEARASLEEALTSYVDLLPEGHPTLAAVAKAVDALGPPPGDSGDAAAGGGAGGSHAAAITEAKMRGRTVRGAPPGPGKGTGFVCVAATMITPSMVDPDGEDAGGAANDADDSSAWP